MLDLERVDLRSLAEALEDYSPETTWWFDPQTGETEPYFADPVSAALDEEEEDWLDRGLIRIEPIPSREAYGDMEDFIDRVRDPRARDLLERAIAGRGAFRRFKDTLLDFQELREVWFAFHDARMERRVIEWLADQGLLERRLVGPRGCPSRIGHRPAGGAGPGRVTLGGAAEDGRDPVAALLSKRRGDFRRSCW